MSFERGFSLIETLIASGLLAVASFATLKTYSFLEIERVHAMQWAQANLLGASQISYLQQINSGAMCQLNSEMTIDIIEHCYIELEQDSPFSLQTQLLHTFYTLDENGQNDVVFAKALNIEISWSNRKGQTQILILPTSVSIYTNLL